MTASAYALQHRNLCYFRAYVRFMTNYSIYYFLFIFLLSGCKGAVAARRSGATSAEGKGEVDRPPMICNNGTTFTCICGSEPTENTKIKYCAAFIKDKHLSVVDMRARHVNLEAQLHTNENYESYFKRRIAQIVNSYCERQVNECPGVRMRINKDEDARAADSVLYATDASEPLLTQDNVVLMRVERKPANVTQIAFVILKSDTLEGKIMQDDTMDPEKVKIILGSQAVPLSRILGGIKLESVRVTSLERLHQKESNKKLIIIIIIAGSFMVICWIIGGFKLARESKKRRKKRKEEQALANTNTANYGTLQERKPSRNGAPIGKGNEHESLYTQIDEQLPPEDENEPHILTDRQAKFMFMCDPSQLPRLPTLDFSDEPDVQETNASMDDDTTDNVQLSKDISSNFYDDQQVAQEDTWSKPTTTVFTEDIYPSKSADTQSPVDTESIPALVIVSSASMRSDTPSSPVVVSENPEDESALLRSESPPINRPQSRRGSRVGEEEIDMTEIGAKKDLFTDLVIPTTTTTANIESQRPVTPDRWSSSEEDVDVYYKMSDDEDIKGDDWNKISKPGITTSEADGEDSDADENPHKDEADQDAYTYERLREEASPLPPHDSQ